MSSAEKDHYFSSQITDCMIANRISDALRQEHADITAAVKQIERVTGINTVTARKWYDGIYAPKSRHLLTLATCYPQVLQAVCELMGMQDIWQQAVDLRIIEKMRMNLDKKWRGWKKNAKTRDKIVTIRVRLNSCNAVQLNQRQLWFLGQLQQGYDVHIHDLVNIWHVHARTAKRDIAGLLKAKLIKAVKVGRTCRYELR